LVILPRPATSIDHCNHWKPTTPLSETDLAGNNFDRRGDRCGNCGRGEILAAAATLINRNFLEVMEFSLSTMIMVVAAKRKE
jgi:hypothetical protein